MKITNTDEWNSLQSHWDDMRDVHMRDLFDQDKNRFDNMSLQACGLLLDYSKNRITEETLDLLNQLAEKADLKSWIKRMFAGEKINNSEDRAAMHVALRNYCGDPMWVEGEDVSSAVTDVLAKMGLFVRQVRSGKWTGFSGKPIRDIVNIGIGGSHLGPMMVTEALRHYHSTKLNLHFVSNVDILHLRETLKNLDPATTLFIISSKTFTTQETMTNAAYAREWVCAAFENEPKAVAKHFVAVSTNIRVVTDFGIDERNIFGFWDWVGGRYSLWSSIGLSIALGIGMERFYELLDGAQMMDDHFRRARFSENMPVILALLGIWYGNFAGAETHAILPYNWYLRFLPQYLQQVDMESNGKGTTRDGEPVTYSTSPIVWGGSGADGQHAFFQLLHQGGKLVPADFIAAVRSGATEKKHHISLLATFMAQTEALMRGLTAEEARAEMQQEGLSDGRIEEILPHKVFPGNRPTNAIIMDELSPRRLGALLAMYEHKVFVQGVIWNVNSFDQWGVELGKKLATRIRAELEEGTLHEDHDSSTLGQMKYFFNLD